MRYLAAAALCGTLVLAGCSQDMPSAPTEPDPEASAALRCIKPGFPLKLAVEQIVGTRNTPGLYPKSRPRPLALALARVAEIAALWTLCKPARAQEKVAVHTTILFDDYSNGRLIGGTSDGTAGRVVTHVNTMWQAVGFAAPNPPVTPGTGTNFGFGLFVPGEELLVNTGSDDGAVLIPDDGFTEPTLITILQRPATPSPFDPDDNVSPPFYEIIASNASNTHYLANGATAIVGFCVDDEVFPAILDMSDPAIAHIAVAEGTNPGGFEILDDASTVGLGLGCESPSETGSLFDGGLKGFASAAPRALRAAAASLFLPTRAEAAASALGKTGLGGLARSLSPFGVVDRDGGEEVENEVQAFDNDPSGEGAGPFVAGQALDDCNGDSCGPEFRVENSDGAPVTTPTQLTVTLLPDEGSTGTLSGTTVLSTSETSPYVAEFDDLIISEPGSYRLSVSAPFAASDTTGSFSVDAPPVPSSFGSAGWHYKQVSSSAPVLTGWLTITPTAADGWATGSAPFGSNDVSSCDGLAPVSTPWNVGTTMLLRRDIFIPENTVSATIEVLVDNNVFVFVNGVDVSSPVFNHEGCANLNPLAGFTVQASPTGPLLPGQVNKIFIRGVDSGVQSYLDARITLTAGE